MTTRQRKPGVVRDLELLEPPVAPCVLIPGGQAGAVRINDQQYALSYHGFLPATGGAVIEGYRLVSEESGKVYDLRPYGGTLLCDCPHAEVSRCQCKHGISLCRLIAEGKIASPEESCME